MTTKKLVRTLMISTALLGVGVASTTIVSLGASTVAEAATVSAIPTGNTYNDTDGTVFTKVDNHWYFFDTEEGETDSQDFADTYGFNFVTFNIVDNDTGAVLKTYTKFTKTADYFSALDADMEQGLPTHILMNGTPSDEYSLTNGSAGYKVTHDGQSVTIKVSKEDSGYFENDDANRPLDSNIDSESNAAHASLTQAIDALPTIGASASQIEATLKNARFVGGDGNGDYLLSDNSSKLHATGIGDVGLNYTYNEGKTKYVVVRRSSWEVVQAWLINQVTADNDAGGTESQVGDHTNSNSNAGVSDSATTSTNTNSSSNTGTTTSSDNATSNTVNSESSTSTDGAENASATETSSAKTTSTRADSDQSVAVNKDVTSTDATTGTSSSASDQSKASTSTDATTGTSSNASGQSKVSTSTSTKDATAQADTNSSDGQKKATLPQTDEANSGWFALVGTILLSGLGALSFRKFH
ncbi:LPXTG cell wall anchor domain-containing protein [Lactiplantibacillus pentosus]|uniref:LPXTG cell wall anchor domain-containing protein n=1 Tax=Lactiplantibacillus pentosus TaxID=1589 RepID=UPI001C1EC814|nr:LPXTG cell wall anchor domain-containing protein [Lactiplantibacillus pentosus]MBU7492264.1 LPXTG cell wall anchor domain-containing protein [Lactiplantibacillus pentosus]MBU7518689.1 LPXTG cell wall anchor domain-containing protein [Lactiplantibacillus pentosus]MCA1342483.1 LPXTG cell wall anchor domain-containing protein [Lactiplantibacillus pentosus]MCJ8184500.1 LPXTG cell wall anchor domain-containing protein [Lactiplantibacillus pentosus]